MLHNCTQTCLLHPLPCPPSASSCQSASQSVSFHCSVHHMAYGVEEVSSVETVSMCMETHRRSEWFGLKRLEGSYVRHVK